MFSLAFIPLGFAAPGQDIGQTNFLLDIAPDRRRSAYLGFSYLVMLPLAWWPVVGALIIGTARFSLAFALGSLAAAAALLTVTRLDEPRADDLALADAPAPEPDAQSVPAGG